MFSSLLPKPKYAPYKPPSSIVPSSSGAKSRQFVSISSLASTLPSSQTSAIANPHKSATTLSTIIVDAEGNIEYDLTIASAASNGTRKVQASYEDTIPLKKLIPNLKHHFPRYDLETCPDDSLKECVEETRDVVSAIINSKLGIDENKKSSDVTYVKYKTNSVIDNEDGIEEEDGRGRERIIQIRNYQEDPMLPPKFKLRKNRHKNPSPPPPILKDTSSSQAKLTKEDREKWRIPAAVSNWKNNQGFTISLDKRMKAANGGEDGKAADVNIEKFGNLSSALEDADKQARDDIKLRNEMLRELAIKEKKEKEERLRDLAELTRNERFNSKKRSKPHDDNYGNKRNRY
ncbi:component of the spliceosome [Scheffersomyces xylosifermentans]|uniref:component of the spliceosome n=1 Tax=Scheffersomyces xylosifermentans TaxID=1304137 RepID=UPI00315CCA6C